MKSFLPVLLLFTFSAVGQEQFTVHFDFDAAVANEASQQKLSEWIKRNSDAKIQKIYGYTDLTGNNVYNLDLSKRRIQYVYMELKASNINTSDAAKKGFGESEAVAEYNEADRKVVIQYAKPAIQPALTQSESVEVKPTANKPELVKSELSKDVTNAKKGDKILLKNLNFYNNEDVMLPSSTPVLRELLAMLKEHPKLKIQIQGHVCCEPENKIKLSRKRAIAVYNYLVRNGISKRRLSYTSFGSTRPIYPIPEKTEEEKTANRRVEIEIVEN
jgi:outer membrane protein OmpA-like peptidoglycan-associated protein